MLVGMSITCSGARSCVHSATTNQSTSKQYNNSATTSKKESESLMHGALHFQVDLGKSVPVHTASSWHGKQSSVKADCARS
eukprot:3969091-Amphidinium_carterae.1